MNTTSISIQLKVNMQEQNWSVAIMAHKAAAELHHNKHLVIVLTKHVEGSRSGRFNTHDHTQRIGRHIEGCRYMFYFWFRFNCKLLTICIYHSFIKWTWGLNWWKSSFVVVAAASHTDKKTNHAKLTLRLVQSLFVFKPPAVI